MSREIINSFLHTFKTLIKELLIYLNNDAEIVRFNKRVMLAIQYDPYNVFDNVGEYLYKYKHLIYNNSSDDVLLSWIPEETKDKQLDDIAVILTNNLKIVYKNLNESNRLFFKKLLVNMLDNYVEYVYITKCEK